MQEDQFSSHEMYYATLDQYKKEHSTYFDSSITLQPLDDGNLHPTYEAKINNKKSNKHMYQKYISTGSKRKRLMQTQ